MAPAFRRNPRSQRSSGWPVLLPSTTPPAAVRDGGADQIDPLTGLPGSDWYLFRDGQDKATPVNTKRIASIALAAATAGLIWSLYCDDRLARDRDIVDSLARPTSIYHGPTTEPARGESKCSQAVPAALH